MKCQYKESFLKEGKEEYFECDEESIISKKYCIFHDEDFLKNADNSEIESMKKQFKTKIKIQEETGEIKCIGYRLPEIEFDLSAKNILIYFTRAVFYGRVNFISKIFMKDISFSYARFKKGLNFRDTTFCGKVDFSKSVSEQKSNFRSCKFHKYANFAVKKFVNVNFSNAIFHNETNFTQGCMTGKESYFLKTIFKKKSLFKSTTFDAKTSFNQAIFHNEADFSKADFSKPVLFENTEFKNQEEIIFNGNIRNVSFLETQISKIRFGNDISWKGLQSNEIDGLGRWWRLKRRSEKIINKISKEVIKRKRIQKIVFKILDKLEKYEKTWDLERTRILLKIGHGNINYKIFDEHVLEKSKQIPYPLESIKDVYRQLIENFDKQMRYDLSGQFFVREMELRRKYKTIQNENKIFTLEKNKFRKYISILWIYNILAQYGQSYRRSIYLMIPILGLSTLYFWLLEPPDLSWSDITLETLQKAFTRTMSGFFPFYDVRSTDITETLTPVDWMLRVMLLPITGTFFVALKRKLERKFRY